MPRPPSSDAPLSKAHISLAKPSRDRESSLHTFQDELRRPPRIYVLAGVNGAGKSSIGGAAFRQSGGDYYNPDEVAASLNVGRSDG